MVVDDFCNLAGYSPGPTEILYDQIIAKRAAQPWDEVWAKVRDLYPIEGYFVDKVMFHYLAKLSKFMSGGSITEAPHLHQFSAELVDPFHLFFRNAIWVYIERNDVFAQAVSRYLAEETNVWNRWSHLPYRDPGHEAVKYDAVKLKDHLTGLAVERDNWQRFFQHYKITPIQIEYEDAVQNYPAYLGELFAKTGLRMIADIPKRRVLKIGDAVNEKFAKWLRDECIGSTSGVLGSDEGTEATDNPGTVG
jgi:LPS sulfotransferase NodH